MPKSGATEEHWNYKQEDRAARSEVAQVRETEEAKKIKENIT